MDDHGIARLMKLTRLVHRIEQSARWRFERIE